jgi:hypothetical protein
MLKCIPAELVEHQGKVKRHLRFKANRRSPGRDPGLVGGPCSSWSLIRSRKSAPRQVVAVNRERTRASDWTRPLKASTNAAGSLEMHNVCCTIACTLASVFLTW